MKYFKLFLMSFLQVFLVACNTWQISKGHTIGAGIVGYMITFVWCFNVRSVSVSDLKEKIVYSFGAGVGTICGMTFSKYIYEIITTS